MTSRGFICSKSAPVSYRSNITFSILFFKQANQHEHLINNCKLYIFHGIMLKPSTWLMSNIHLSHWELCLNLNNFHGRKVQTHHMAVTALVSRIKKNQNCSSNRARMIK